MPSAVVILFLSMGTSQGAFRLFDDFEDEEIAPVGGQDGWVSTGGDNQIVFDPSDPGNKVLDVPSASSTLRKSLLDASVGIPDGTARMLFMRLRVSNKQTFSVGVSGLSSPIEFSDFAPEIGMANSARNLDVRVWNGMEGNYEIVTQLDGDKWYNMWVFVDTANDQYQIWLNAATGAPATDADRLSAPNGVSTFGFRSGQQTSLRTFYIKTSGGSSGSNSGPVYFDDIHIENTRSLNLGNPTAALCRFHPVDFDGDCDVDRDDFDLLEACVSGPAVRANADCLAFDLDADADVDQADFGVFQRCYSGKGVAIAQDCGD